MQSMERTTQQTDSTNLITPDKQEQEKQDCYANRESLQQVKHSSEPLEPTEPFSSRELAAIRKQAKQLSAEEKNTSDGRHVLNHDLFQQGEPSEHNPPVSGEAARSPHPPNKSSTVDKTSGRTQGRLPKQYRPGTQRATLRVNKESPKEVTVRSIGVFTSASYTIRNELVLTQLQYDLGYKVQVRSSQKNQKTTQKICMELMFDPGSDVILLCNITGLSEGETINVRELPVSPDSITSYPVHMGRFALNVSSYSIYTSNGHIFDISVLPRRYFSFFKEPRSQPRETHKRSLEPSSSQPDSVVKKRVKTEETSEESSSLTTYYSAPTHPLTDELIATNPRSTVSDSQITVVSSLSGLCHPLEELHLGDAVKIVNETEEEDYELTRIADLSLQPASLVYKASCSKLPALVVKIWRSKLDFDSNSDHPLNVSSIGSHWLNEVKILSEIGRHHAIVKFLGADARLLSIYLEYIDAPSLQSYCERRPNTYCQLDYIDARRVLYAIADALSFCHAQGITHHDIKPANILYSKARGPVLIDFGWSRCLPEKKDFTAGSPWYIPPEYMTTGNRGPPGDVFALGVVMLFLLGQIPLPELQSPPLNWKISHLRQTNHNALKAKDKMHSWLTKVNAASIKLDRSSDLMSNRYVGDIVFLIQGMLKFGRQDRITANALFLDLRIRKNPDCGNINLIEARLNG
ncbi:kinase-like domain-containing protein [Trichoderma chlorosporum]